VTLADGGYPRQALWFDAPIAFIWLSNLPIWDADIYNSAHDAFIEYFSSNQTIHQAI
jgi:hypothetical protein